MGQSLRNIPWLWCSPWHENSRLHSGISSKKYGRRNRFGMTSLVRLRLPDHVDTFIGYMDFVVLSAPLTESTKGFINAARLKRMKPTAYLINVSRGPLIDDNALLAALRGKKIGGAALDVFEEEPLPPNSPYWTLDNCLITPHIAALTEKLWERHYSLFADNLHRFMSGKELRGLVDKQRGY